VSMPKDCMSSLVSFDIAHCSDANTVFFKDLTFLFIGSINCGVTPTCRDCRGNRFSSW